MPSPLPGFETPAASFEQPFEMLEACHDRVRRSLGLLERLIAHVDARGHDAASRDAARDVLRYFDVAAPLHHQDEELHVFPRLLGSGDAELMAAAERLRTEHERMSALWASLRVPLSRWTDPATSGPLDAAERLLAREFQDLYAGHMEREEGVAFPVARDLTDPLALAEMGAEMQGRRLA